MSTPFASTKVLLVPDPRAGASESEVVPLRRYRLARLRFDNPAPDAPKGFSHLGRSHD